MKKTILAACVFVLVAGFSMTSCSKKKECVCTTNTAGMEVSITQEHTGDCSELNSEVTSGGMTITTTCK